MPLWPYPECWEVPSPPMPRHLWVPRLFLALSGPSSAPTQPGTVLSPLPWTSPGHPGRARHRADPGTAPWHRAASRPRRRAVTAGLLLLSWGGCKWPQPGKTLREGRLLSVGGGWYPTASTPRGHEQFSSCSPTGSK